MTARKAHRLRLRWLPFGLLLAALIAQPLWEIGAGLVYLAGSSRAQAGQTQEALALLRTAEWLAPHLPYAPARQAELLAADAPDVARAALGRALAVDVTYPPARNNLAVLQLTDAPAAGLASAWGLLDGLGASTAAAAVPFNRGVVAWASGETREADRSLHLAALLDPSRLETQVALASFLLAQERFAEAEAASLAALALAPNQRTAHSVLVQSRLATEQYPAGLAAAEAALARFPGDWEFVYLQAVLQHKSGDVQSARGNLEAVLFRSGDQTLRRQAATAILALEGQ